MAKLVFVRPQYTSTVMGQAMIVKGAILLLPPTVRRPGINLVSSHLTIVTQGQKRPVQWQVSHTRTRRKTVSNEVDLKDGGDRVEDDDRDEAVEVTDVDVVAATIARSNLRTGHIVLERRIFHGGEFYVTPQVGCI